MKEALQKNYFRLSEPYDWICGGTIPCYIDNLNFLQQENVGAIVSLTIEQLKPGLNIHHLPFEHENTEYVLGDIYNATEECEIEECTCHQAIQSDFDFTFIHVACADAGPLTLMDAVHLIRRIKSYRKEHPNKAIYFHCWQGRGRTAMAINYVLQKLYKLSFEDACKIIDSCIPDTVLSRIKPAQLRFLKGEKILEEDQQLFYPVMKTPKDHKVWKVKNSFILHVKSLYRAKGVKMLDVKVADVSDVIEWKPSSGSPCPEWFEPYHDPDGDDDYSKPMWAWHLFAIKRQIDPTIQGASFKSTMTTPKLRKIFDVIQ
jgi:hypothetical protein